MHKDSHPGAVSRRSVLKAGAALAAAGSLSGLAGFDTLAASEAPPPQGMDAKTKELLALLKGTPATLIMDALIRLGHDRMKLALSSDLKPVFKSSGTIIGPAVTTKYEQTRGNGSIEDIRKYVFKPVDDAEPGAIWVTGAGTDQLLSMFGDLIVQACKKKGLAGLVTDSGCRDIEAMEAIGLPVYARGPVLYSPGSVISPVAANVPVICGGVEVRPGDIVVADVNGVLAFPREALPDVVAKRKELGDKEALTRRLIEQGEPLTTAYQF